MHPSNDAGSPSRRELLLCESTLSDDMLERSEAKLAQDPIENAEQAEPIEPIDAERADGADRERRAHRPDRAERVLRPERPARAVHEQVVGAGLPATRSLSHPTRSSCAATITVPWVAPSYTR